MTRVSWCLTVAVDGELKTIFPGVIPDEDLAILQPVVARAVDRRLKIEAAARAQDAAVPSAAKPRPPHVEAIMTQSEIAKAQGYAGDPCSKCGGWRMKQSGHCRVCDDCGETTGCS